MCQAPGRSWGLTVAGRDDCPANAVLDYAGYLMTDKYNAAARSEHICVDRSTASGAEWGATGGDATSGTLFPVETVGMQLSPSSGYGDYSEITCAQCSSSAGPTYVRWGRSSCPPAATLLYSGRAAGSHRSQNGGGHNYVCLHDSPKYFHNDTTQAASGGRLYRAEYETSNKGIKTF